MLGPELQISGRIPEESGATASQDALQVLSHWGEVQYEVLRNEALGLRGKVLNQQPEPVTRRIFKAIHKDFIELQLHVRVLFWVQGGGMTESNSGLKSLHFLEKRTQPTETK